MTRPDFLVYWESLKDKDPEALREVLKGCRERLDYMPKLHDILERLSPYEEAKSTIDRTKVIRDWREQVSEGLWAHYYELEGGYRVTRMERTT